MRRMKPTEICHAVLGAEGLSGIIGELSSPQIKAVLKEGGLKAKLPAGIVSQARRREIWSSRILGAIEGDNQSVAGELLQQWLLNHHRGLLIAYLDALGVKHRDGETDESFLLSRPERRLREAALALLASHDRTIAAAYLLYIAHQQRASVFEGWEPLSFGSAPAVAPPAGVGTPPTNGDQSRP